MVTSASRPEQTHRDIPEDKQDAHRQPPAPVRVFVVAGGHPFDQTAFRSMLEALPGIEATLAFHPAATNQLNPSALRDYQAILLYDMPGLDFQTTGRRPVHLAPTVQLQAGLRALLEHGKGVVALHHALAGWPDWAEYGDWLGGRFLYRSGLVRGVACTDSGYAPAVTYTAEVVAEHPVTRGLPPVFTLTDELYLAPVFAASVSPLLIARHPFDRSHFWSAAHAVNGHGLSREGWHPSVGSPLIGWAKRAGHSRLVYLQPGDGPDVYANPWYRTLLGNALHWVADRQTEHGPLATQLID